MREGPRTRNGNTPLSKLTGRGGAGISNTAFQPWCRLQQGLGMDRPCVLDSARGAASARSPAHESYSRPL